MFNNKDRVLVAWFVNQVEGVNRTDARLVANVSREFRVEDRESIAVDNLNDPMDPQPDISKLELEWLMDQSKKAFENSNVPPQRASWHLDFEDKLEELLDESK